MTTPEAPDGTDDGAPAKTEGDPLLDSAQGRGDGSSASRHGADADGVLDGPSDGSPS